MKPFTSKTCQPSCATLSITTSSCKWLYLCLTKICSSQTLMYVLVKHKYTKFCGWFHRRFWSHFKMQDILCMKIVCNHKKKIINIRSWLFIYNKRQNHLWKGLKDYNHGRTSHKWSIMLQKINLEKFKYYIWILIWPFTKVNQWYCIHLTMIYHVLKAYTYNNSKWTLFNKILWITTFDT